MNKELVIKSKLENMSLVEHFVDDASIVGLGDEAGTDALNLVGTALAAVQHRA